MALHALFDDTGAIHEQETNGVLVKEFDLEIARSNSPFELQGSALYGSDMGERPIEILLALEIHESANQSRSRTNNSYVNRRTTVVVPIFR